MVKYVENFTLHEVVGEGVTCKVYRAINRCDNKEYAAKVAETNKCRNSEERIVSSISILINIEKNQHIISYYDMINGSNRWYFFFEYCNGGTLEDKLRKEQILDEKNGLLIFKQLLSAFKTLEKSNII